MNPGSAAARPLAIGALAAAAVLAVGTTPVRLRPDDASWRWAVAGASRDGIVQSAALVFLPGVDRTRPLELRIAVAPGDGSAGRIGAATSAQKTVEWHEAGAATPWTVLPGSGPGLELRLHVERPTRITALEVAGASRPAVVSSLLAFVVGALGAWALGRLAGPAVRTPLALVFAGACGVAASPLVLLASLGQPAVLLRALVPVTLVATGTLLAARRRETRRAFAIGTLLVGAAVFGAAVRAAFAPSLGSWDLDYWKACARRVVTAGVTQAYGGADAVPPGHFFDQIRGREAAWEVPSFGKTFVVDQPPAIQALWGLGLRWSQATAVGLSPEEVENAGAKIPPLVGDILAVALLLAAFRSRPERGAALAALYWALPVSWLSSAVMGYIDGTLAPLAVAAVLAAGRGRARAAGLLFGLAALVKSTALLVAPAVVVALLAARAPVRRAVAWGAGLVLLALVPFAWTGTLATAVVHCVRVLVQRRLSGGFGNVWWIASWLHGLAAGRSRFEPISFVETKALAPLPANAVGAVLFLAAACWIGRALWRHAGPAAAALAAAALVVAYGQTAIGVHENHPHTLVLALLASGLATRRLRILAGIFLSTYVLNMLALSGLGRFSGLRYVPLDPLIAAARGLRMALGLDVTLVLAVVNVCAFAWLMGALPAEMAAAQAASGPAAADGVGTTGSSGSP